MIPEQLVNQVENVALLLTEQQVLQVPVTLELDLEDIQHSHMNYWSQETYFLAEYIVLVT